MKLSLPVRGVAGAAVLIGAITVLARIAGFGRTLVFSQSVTNECLSDTYFAANMVPNIVFEIVAGGALASVVVPLLAGPVERADQAEIRRITSAMLTWVTLILLPLSVLIAVAAGPLMALLVRPGAACGHDEMARVGADMLMVFAPQILLYGLAVVLYGVLQAHRRFTGPAIAPLISSLVVICAYLAYVPLHVDRRTPLADLPAGAVPILAVGTTLGVVALVLTAVVAAWPIGLRVRPTLRFPVGVAGRARGLAAAGLATVAAQQVATLGVLVLSNGTDGALTRYQFAWAVFLLPWAVLAVPIATSAYPVLSAQAVAVAPAAERTSRATGRPGADGSREKEGVPGKEGMPGTEDVLGAEGPGTQGPRTRRRPAANAFDRTVAGTTRAVLLASCAGSALLVAVAVPAAHFLRSAPDLRPGELAWAIVAFAPGLPGYGLVAHLGRALYACGRGRVSAGAVVVGWLGVLVADIGLVAALDLGSAGSTGVVVALGAGNTLGMTLAGVLLLAGLARVRGGAALAGIGRALPAGVAGGVVAGVSGYGVAMAIGTGGRFTDLVAVVAAATCAAAVFLLIAFVTDRGDLRAVLRRAPARAAADDSPDAVDP